MGGVGWMMRKTHQGRGTTHPATAKDWVSGLQRHFSPEEKYNLKRGNSRRKKVLRFPSSEGWGRSGRRVQVCPGGGGVYQRRKRKNRGTNDGRWGWRNGQRKIWGGLLDPEKGRWGGDVGGSKTNWVDNRVWGGRGSGKVFIDKTEKRRKKPNKQGGGDAEKKKEWGGGKKSSKRCVRGREGKMEQSPLGHWGKKEKKKIDRSKKYVSPRARRKIGMDCRG